MNPLQAYNTKSKYTCTLTTLTLVVIIAYFISPFHLGGVSNFCAKTIIMGLLCATIYFQFTSSNELLNINQLFTDEKNHPERNQYLTGVLFSIILTGFLLFIGKELFF
jgi:hypothetical protein